MEGRAEEAGGKTEGRRSRLSTLPLLPSTLCIIPFTCVFYFVILAGGAGVVGLRRRSIAGWVARRQAEVHRPEAPEWCAAGWVERRQAEVHPPEAPDWRAAGWFEAGGGSSPFFRERRRRSVSTASAVCARAVGGVCSTAFGVCARVSDRAEGSSICFSLVSRAIPSTLHSIIALESQTEPRVVV